VTQRKLVSLADVRTLQWLSSIHPRYALTSFRSSPKLYVAKTYSMLVAPTIKPSGSRIPLAPQTH
jgi:hypothetical protein